MQPTEIQTVFPSSPKACPTNRHHPERDAKRPRAIARHGLTPRFRAQCPAPLPPASVPRVLRSARRASGPPDSSPDIIASIEAVAVAWSAPFEDSAPDCRRFRRNSATRGASFRIARVRGRTRPRSSASPPDRSPPARFPRRPESPSERRGGSRAASSPAKPPLTRPGATPRCRRGRWPPSACLQRPPRAPPRCPTAAPATFPAPAASGSGVAWALAPERAAALRQAAAVNVNWTPARQRSPRSAARSSSSRFGMGAAWMSRHPPGGRRRGRGGSGVA